MNGEVYSDSVTSVLAAVQLDDLESLKRLVSRKGDICLHGHRDNRGWGPLHYAAHFGSPRCLDYLLTREMVDCNEEAHNGDRPLFLAISSLNRDTVHRMLESPRVQVDLEHRDGRTALFLAIKTSSFEVVKWLVRLGADPDILFRCGHGHEIHSVHIDVIRYLLRKGLDKARFLATTERIDQVSTLLAEGSISPSVFIDLHEDIFAVTRRIVSLPEATLARTIPDPASFKKHMVMALLFIMYFYAAEFGANEIVRKLTRKLSELFKPTIFRSRIAILPIYEGILEIQCQTPSLQQLSRFAILRNARLFDKSDIIPHPLSGRIFRFSNLEAIDVEDLRERFRWENLDDIGFVDGEVRLRDT